MSTLLSHTILSAHDPASGRYDALRVARTLALSTEEMAQALGLTLRGLRKNPDSPQLQAELAELVALTSRLRELLDGSIKYVRIWPRAPRPDLGGRTPLSYLLEGKLEVLDALVRAIETGQPG